MFLNIIVKILLLVIGVETELNEDGYGDILQGSFRLHSYSSVEQRKESFEKEYPLLGVLFLFCSAYLIAALVEESCKYFGFKMVEHPDFVSEKDLQEAEAIGVFDEDEYDDDRFECGGGFECGNEDEEDVFVEETEQPTAQTMASRFVDGTAGEGGILGSNEQKNDQESTKKKIHPCGPKSLNTTGAAITVAMVSVSLGFACCENLIYIFLYNRGPLDSEIAVLISRSLFPVHPLCAGKMEDLDSHFIILFCVQKKKNDSLNCLSSCSNQLSKA